jgi:hypothetical protein
MIIVIISSSYGTPIQPTVSVTKQADPRSVPADPRTAGPVDPRSTPADPRIAGPVDPRSAPADPRTAGGPADPRSAPADPRKRKLENTDIPQPSSSSVIVPIAEMGVILESTYKKNDVNLN